MRLEFHFCEGDFNITYLHNAHKCFSSFLYLVEMISILPNFVLTDDFFCDIVWNCGVKCLKVGNLICLVA